MPEPARILTVDDEPAILRFLNAVLTAHGYVVIQADTGAEALDQVKQHRPDVVILDLGLPDVDGVTVVRLLREWSSVPVIVLSVRDAEADKVAALDAGADDYLTKPFGTAELLARVRVALRRTAQTSAPEGGVFSFSGLRVDFTVRRVQVDEVDIALTPTEYDILRVLIRHAGRVMTHQQLLREVWGPGYESERHMLRVNMSNLRRKLEPEPARPRYLLTEPGVGYRLRTEE